MTDLVCRKCGQEASYADAHIGDLRRTCGVEATPDNATKTGHYGGEKHDWTEKGDS